MATAHGQPRWWRKGSRAWDRRFVSSRNGTGTFGWIIQQSKEMGGLGGDIEDAVAEAGMEGIGKARAEAHKDPAA